MDLQEGELCVPEPPAPFHIAFVPHLPGWNSETALGGKTETPDWVGALTTKLEIIFTFGLPLLLAQ